MAKNDIYLRNVFTRIKYLLSHGEKLDAELSLYFACFLISSVENFAKNLNKFIFEKKPNYIQCIAYSNAYGKTYANVFMDMLNKDV